MHKILHAKDITCKRYKWNKIPTIDVYKCHNTPMTICGLGRGVRAVGTVAEDRKLETCCCGVGNVQFGQDL